MSKVPKGKRFLKWSKKTPKDKKFDKDVANEMDNNKHLSKREAMMVTKMRGVLSDE
jgi:hypothetical protein